MQWPEPRTDRWIERRGEEEIGREEDKQNAEMCVHNVQATVLVLAYVLKQNAFAIDLLEPSSCEWEDFQKGWLSTAIIIKNQNGRGEAQSVPLVFSIRPQGNVPYFE